MLPMFIWRNEQRNWFLHWMAGYDCLPPWFFRRSALSPEGNLPSIHRYTCCFPLHFGWTFLVKILFVSRQRVTLWAYSETPTLFPHGWRRWRWMDEYVQVPYLLGFDWWRLGLPPFAYSGLGISLWFMRLGHPTADYVATVHHLLWFNCIRDLS